MNPFGGPTVFYKNKETEKKHAIRTKSAIGGVHIAEEVLFLFILDSIVFIVILLNRKDFGVSYTSEKHLSEMQPSFWRLEPDRYHENTLLLLNMDDCHPILKKN